MMKLNRLNFLKKYAKMLKKYTCIWIKVTNSIKKKLMGNISTLKMFDN